MRLDAGVRIFGKRSSSPVMATDHPAPAAADLRRGIQVLGSESGIDPAAGPAISTKGLMSPVIR
jgi:hypothetical protein